MAVRDDARTSAIVSWTVYLCLAILVVTEKLGQTTSDTRLDMTDAPIRFLEASFSLWNPRVSLGELQNQAYGYLFPQGPFFALAELAHVPGWLAERAWSVLLLVAACEGLRRVVRACGASPWAATLAGLAYGLNPRLVAELGVRSAEVLPGAVLPWALLPLLHAVNGRMRPRTAVLLSAAAFAFSGGVNGTATAAPGGLLVVFVLWAALSRRLSWRAAAGWGALMVVTNLWWVASLLRLGRYSPPFFDYVEDARTTTSSAGFSAGLRGASNWVDYIVIAGRAWWPAGYDVSFSRFVVLTTGGLAVLGVVGLLRYRGRFRVPLLVSAVLGIACVSIAHTSVLGGPFAATLRDLLDGPLAPLRNVPKADPILRLPLAVGVAVVLDEVLAAARRTGTTRRTTAGRRVGAGAVVAAVVLCLLGASTPVLAANLRTPGWRQLPDWWTQTADFLDAEPAGGSAWVVPASGFGIETWGWTMEEPLQVLGQTPWVTRSQVPLVPAPTLRMLSTLEQYLTTGSGSPYLRNVLRRIGIDRIVVRHDLDPEVSLSAPPSLVSVALARSPGIERVATFGALTYGPAIEVYDVDDADGARPDGDTDYQVRDVADSRTVATSVEDVVAAAGSGLVGDDQVMVTSHEPDWDRPVDVVGDGFRRRERAFGRVEDAESGVMTATDPYRGGRVVPNYPGPPGADPVVARWSGVAGVSASSSVGYADVLGDVRPGNAPAAVLDGDDSTFWQSAPYLDPRGQWVDVDLGAPRPVHTVTLQAPLRPLGIQPVQRWRVSAGGVSREVAPDPTTGSARVDLGGVRADHVRVTVVAVADRVAPVGLAGLEIGGPVISRTLVVPDAGSTALPDYLFTAAPESRACATTLLGPDCDVGRSRRSEEATGIDRTFAVSQPGTWRVRGLSVARTEAATTALLEPPIAPQGQGSSWLDQDPTVAPRMAWDGDPGTSWVADPRDRRPTLTFDLGRTQTLSSLTVSSPAPVAQRPTHATITGGGQVREVDLDGFGRFDPIRARRVTIAFSRPADPGAYAIGVGEIHLAPYDVAVPLDGSTPTGAACGFGPQLVVDGRTYRTKVSGLIGSVVANGQQAVVPCDGPLDLTRGEHRIALRSTDQFEPVNLRLKAIRDRHPVTPSRTVRLMTDGIDHRVVRVSAGEDAVLSLPQNFNAGWTATLGGRRLKPIQVDGWAQGWRVPADLAGDVVLDFAPQRGYLLTLLAGLTLLGLVLVTALVVAVRTRLMPGRPPADLLEAGPAPPVASTPTPVVRSRVRRVLVVLGATALAGVVGGPVVALGAFLGVLLAAHRRLCLLVTTVVLGGALVALVVQLTTARAYPATPVDLATGAGLAFALAAAATVRPARSRRHRAPSGRPHPSATG